MPGDLARRIAAHTAADRAWRRALDLESRSGAWDDPATLAEMCRLLDEARQLRAEAGSSFEVHLGGRVFRYGFGAP